MMGSPPRLDRIIVHQFDAARPSPGGIDTCIRGILRYGVQSQQIGVVGVDVGSGPAGRQLGKWEEHDFGGGTFYFLPVAKLDPADQSRRIPHSVRLIAGLARYRRRIPSPDAIQAHRADTANATSLLFKSPLTYFVHTQEAGLTGSTSDSFWKRAAHLHRLLEMRVIKRADGVAVFNPEYAKLVATQNPRAQGFPTWYDPDLLSPSAERKEKTLLWVGRLEEPKDPSLAVAVYKELVQLDEGWVLDIVGSGTLLNEVKGVSSDTPGIRVHGRVSPNGVAELMGASDVFLMTSWPGYEGFPRVLVEAMANGMRPVVTRGSDTGGLIRVGETGFVTGREPREIAEAILAAQSISRVDVAEVVSSYSAPRVVHELYSQRAQS